VELTVPEALIDIGSRVKGRSQSALASRLFPLFTMALAALIIHAVVESGVKRGMDRVLTFGPESDQNTIAVAITELVYGVDSYVAYYPVLEALVKVIHRGADGPNDPKILPNLSDGDLINEAITNARSLGPQGELFLSDGGLRTMVYDDLGMVDFAKLAFSLFAFNIEAFYFLYFSILSLSALTFLIQFRRSPIAQALLLCNLVAFYLEVQTQIFNEAQPTFWGLRHGSTLVILPMWHLVLLMAHRVRLSLPALALAVIQVAITVLV
jgi:hypothetical protein